MFNMHNFSLNHEQICLMGQNKSRGEWDGKEIIMSYGIMDYIYFHLFHIESNYIGSNDKLK